MKKLNLDVWERPKPHMWFLLSLQHVFAMFGATVLVPILTGLDVGVALIGSGIGTLIYIILTKAKVPMYLGSSFAYISAIVSAHSIAGDFSSAFIGMLAVGIIYIIVAVIIYFFGTKWLKWLLPTVVVGPMIMVIGLSLAPIAIGNITTLADGTASTWRHYLVAIVTFITIVIVSVKGKGFSKIIPFLFGVVAGYLTALAVKIVDFSVFEGLRFFSLPNFKFIGTYKPNFAALSVFIPLSFVTIMEHIGDHQALGSIMDRDFMEEPGLHRTLLGDGVATLVAGTIGAPPNTSYGENTGVVALTKVGSVWVTGLAAVIAILLAFISPINAFITSIPAPVLGGMSLVLFGMIGANGLKVLFEDKIDFGDIRNILIIASMLVIGLSGILIEFGGGIEISAMAISAVLGILLNLFFKLLDLITNSFDKHVLKIRKRSKDSDVIEDEPIEEKTTDLELEE